MEGFIIEPFFRDEPPWKLHSVAGKTSLPFFFRIASITDRSHCSTLKQGRPLSVFYS